MTKKSSATLFAFLFGLALFSSSSHLAFADTFTDQAGWEAAVCGDVFPDELEYGQRGVGDILVQVLPTSWGDIDYPFFANNSGFNLGGDTGIILDQPPMEFAFASGLGSVSGVSFDYQGTGVSLCIELADGTIVEEVASSATERTFFGWTNTTGQDVTAVSVKAVDADDPNGTGGALLFAVGFGFGECTPNTPTCQDLLADLIVNLEDKLAVAGGNDQLWIQDAINELVLAQAPELWETENRLSDAGCVFFGHNFYATYYLECVYDQALVNDCLIGIQDLLGCVVDAEIQYATENPNGSSNLLLYAEYFEDYADLFADAELYLEAVILHFYAWLFASHASD